MKYFNIVLLILFQAFNTNAQTMKNHKTRARAWIEKAVK